MPEMDQIVKAKKPQRHVLVIHKGKLFTLDAFDDNWNIRVREFTRKKPLNQTVRVELLPIDKHEIELFIEEMKAKSWET